MFRVGGSCNFPILCAHFLWRDKIKSNILRLKRNIRRTNLSEFIDLTDDVYSITRIEDALQNTIENIDCTNKEECCATKKQQSPNFAHYISVVILSNGASSTF